MSAIAFFADQDRPGADVAGILRPRPSGSPEGRAARRTRRLPRSGSCVRKPANTSAHRRGSAPVKTRTKSDCGPDRDLVNVVLASLRIDFDPSGQRLPFADDRAGEPAACIAHRLKLAPGGKIKRRRQREQNRCGTQRRHDNFAFHRLLPWHKVCPSTSSLSTISSSAACADWEASTRNVRRLSPSSD